MNVASLENCKRLYELSGWGETDYWYTQLPDGSYLASDWLDRTEGFAAYDLGYLLRKLNDCHTTLTNEWAAGGWRAVGKANGEMYVGKQFVQVADNPEDAAALLCIKLIEEGVLKI